jgi:hypothetical protein
MTAEAEPEPVPSSSESLIMVTAVEETKFTAVNWTSVQVPP